MKQYAAALPSDTNQQTMQEYPAAKKALARYGAENAGASSVITLTDSTTVLEVSATSGAAALRWVPSTETAAVAPAASVILTGGTANFDHIIEANQTRRFVVPIEKQGVTASIVGANVLNGLFKRVAYMSAGPISSVYASEF